LYFFYQIVLFIRFFITFGTLKTILFIIMKKLLLTGAFALASFLTAQAQTVILSENFDDTDAVYDSGWFTIDADGDANGFAVYFENATLTQIGFSEQVAGSGNFTTDEDGNFVASSPDTNNYWASPSIEVPEDGAYVSFKVAGIPLVAGAVAPYSLYVLDEEALTALSNEDLTLEEALDIINGSTIVASAANAPTAATQVNADLADYAGQTIALAWRYNNASTGDAYFFIDDVVVTSGLLATNNVVATQFSVFPNPANDIVTIANADNALVNNVSIVDINGRTVKSVKLGGVANAQINVSDLAKGVYVMTISSDKGATTQKLMKN
jgi:hypothetical protein